MIEFIVALSHALSLVGEGEEYMELKINIESKVIIALITMITILVKYIFFV